MKFGGGSLAGGSASANTRSVASEAPEPAKGEPRAWLRASWRELVRPNWPRVLAFLAWVTLLVSTYASLLGVVGSGEVALIGGATLYTVPLLLTVLVALPNVTLFVIARMVMFHMARRQFSLRCTDEPGAPSAVPERARTQAETMWQYERHRTQARMETSLLPQVAVFGLIASATLAFCVLGIHLPPDQIFSRHVSGATPTWHIWVAWTVLATATTSLLLSFGRILVRVAGNDATTRTFAHAARSYVLCVISGGLLGCITVTTTDANSAQSCIALGIAVGLLGDRAVLAVSNRAAALIGAEVMTTDPSAAMRAIEGLLPDDVQRLQEENIGSVHALAFVPVPRLFFNSSINIQRICDWQDQALLQVYVGEGRAKALRDNFQIRGAIDAQRLALTREQLSPEVWQQLVASLGFPGEAHLQQLFARLAHDERIDVLRAYRGASLRMDIVDPRAAET